MFFNKTILIILCLFGVMTVLAETSSTPISAVKNYLELDRKGGIFNVKTLKNMIAIYPDLEQVDWKERASVTTIITSYHIKSVESTLNEATVNVVFDKVGNLEDFERFVSQPGTELVEIRLAKKGERWTIVSDLWHHINGNRIISYLQQRKIELINSGISFDKHKYDNTIESIRNATK